MVPATLTINGRPTKVVMEANRNGSSDVLDRDRGQLPAANPFVGDIATSART
jgi:alcohol dehydrogenase (cytochrome c)